ncbi:MAG: hypothetical protein AAF577_08010 [Pseudomonadota bacterium]
MTRYQRFIRDRDGAINLEFMLWLPLLLIWLVATVAAFDGFKARNDSAKAAYTISDILGRFEVVSTADFTDLLTLQRSILRGAPSAGQALRTASIGYDGSNYFVEWSWSSVAGDTFTATEIPFQLMPQMSPGSTVVFTEVFVPYESVLGIDSFGDRLWQFQLFARPRNVGRLVYTDFPGSVQNVSSSLLPERLKNPPSSITNVEAPV